MHSVNVARLFGPGHIRRRMCGTLFSYDWISVPLCYTQMVAVAVYGFFAITLISRQHNSSDTDAINTYFPVFTYLQFLLIVGWMKVGLAV